MVINIHTFPSLDQGPLISCDSTFWCTNPLILLGLRSFYHWFCNKVCILSQWAWFSPSPRNFIGFGQSSTHPLQNDRWTMDSTFSNCRVWGGIAYFMCVNTAHHITRQYTNEIYASDEHHAMLLGFWFETFVLIRGEFIQMTLMKWRNTIFDK